LAELDRIRWHCRRGLLELDIILERFNRQHLARLDPGQLERFKELLEFPDNDLLDLVLGRVAAPAASDNDVLRLLQTV
jgi:antitoxin CptB